ncbi:hypothetical protein DPMN_083737 [Dreissena polymorpha]|uniref:Uncharacterized protein n=1 Tax=Dreissena polymorpha TaxID=45954 RepID=A0A9D3YD94_DREPO|nr:hypothetical protein DPMN_083737 [Dreissena polymorpha]
MRIPSAFDTSMCWAETHQRKKILHSRQDPDHCPPLLHTGYFFLVGGNTGLSNGCHS